MNFLLIVSNKDKASINFKNNLFKNFNIQKLDLNTYKLDLKGINNIYLKIIEDLPIYCNPKNINIKDIDINTIIFLSKHSTSSTNKSKCMTVHAIGNFGTAKYGGKDKCIVKTNAYLIRSLLLNLKNNKKNFQNYIKIKNFEVKQEATHHGPYLEKETIFFEIGSDEESWNNTHISEFMIRILINTLQKFDEISLKKKGWIKAIGIGGSHYCTKFNRLTFNTNNNYCFGHIIPTYAIEDFNKNKKLILKTLINNKEKEIIIKENLEVYDST